VSHAPIYSFTGAGLPACALPLLVLENSKSELIVNQVTLRHRPGGLRQMRALVRVRKIMIK